MENSSKWYDRYACSLYGHFARFAISLMLGLSLTHVNDAAAAAGDNRPLKEKRIPRRSVRDLRMSREPLNSYGSMEAALRAIRDHRPLDLNSRIYHESHPNDHYQQWQQRARDCLHAGLHYDPGPLDLNAEVLRQEETEGIIRELVTFNTTPWFRVKGYFLRPKKARLPLPGLVVFHAWGGPMLFGKERIVNTGRDHPVLQKHREKAYDGKFLAEELAKSGYAVITIDNYHFGERSPRGINGIPADLDPFALSEAEYKSMDGRTRDLLYLGMRQLNWAGTTWAGVNYGDDSRCVDYLLSRPEVDANRIGCTGLSGGGWRTDMLVALDSRVKAAVSVGWMTTGDYQQIYNVGGACGTFTMLPGVWDRIDIPDLIAMSAPCASMVVVGTQDRLFPPEAVKEANHQIQEAYKWAGYPDRFKAYNPAKVHCYDLEIQQEAIQWLNRHLK